jgi:uncharacterized membrane protein YvbJ
LPNCGRQIPDGSSFCPYCGAIMDGKDNSAKTYEEELLKAKAAQRVIL